MRPHEKLDFYKRSIEFVKEIYNRTNCFPEEEKFGLISQLRRAAVSIPTNIAEGAARDSKKEYIRFLYISSGSISEIETLIRISKELDYLKENIFSELKQELNDLSAMASGLIRSLNQ